MKRFSYYDWDAVALDRSAFGPKASDSRAAHTATWSGSMSVCSCSRLSRFSMCYCYPCRHIEIQRLYSVKAHTV